MQLTNTPLLRPRLFSKCVSPAPLSNAVSGRRHIIRNVETAADTNTTWCPRVAAALG